MNIDAIKEYVSFNELNGTNRKQEFVYKRFYIYFFLRTQGMPLTEIGKIFNKHHSSIIYGVNSHINWMHQNDKIYLNCIKDLQELFPIIKIKKVKINLQSITLQDLKIYVKSKNLKPGKHATKQHLIKILIANDDE